MVFRLHTVCLLPYDGMLMYSLQHIRRLPHRPSQFIIHTPVSFCRFSKRIRGTVKSVIGPILKFLRKYGVLAAKLSGDCTCLFLLLPPETLRAISEFHLSRSVTPFQSLVYCSLMGRIKFLPPSPYFYCFVSDPYWHAYLQRRIHLAHF